MRERRRATAGLLMGMGAAVLLTAGCGSSSKTGAPKAAPAPSGSASATPDSTPSHAPSTSPPDSGSPDPTLEALTLSAAEVSRALAPVAETVIPKGTQLGSQRTLDLCNATFPSERERASRLQVAYIVTTPSPGLPVGRVAASNEVVQYSGSGAAAAYRQVQAAARHCPPSVRVNSQVQTGLRILPRDPRLVGNQLTVIDRVSSTGRKHAAEWTAASYLYDGDLFSGIYVYGARRAQVVTACRTLAADASRRLGDSGTLT